MTDEPTFTIDILFGHVEIETRAIPGDDGDILYQGRSKKYDGSGVLITPWETTGVLRWPKPVAKRWWRLW